MCTREEDHSAAKLYPTTIMDISYSSILILWLWSAVSVAKNKIISIPQDDIVCKMNNLFVATSNSHKVLAKKT
jgi:hypothetical protein